MSKKDKRIIRYEFDLANLPPLTSERIAELEALSNFWVLERSAVLAERWFVAR